MDFYISGNTDVGRVKTVNQDGLLSLILQTRHGKMAFSVICDGMGGLEYGELASAAVVQAFRGWIVNELHELCKAPLEDGAIRRAWQNIVSEMNESIQQQAREKGTRMGTTVVAMLLTQDRYYIMNVGDSRAYELTDGIRQISRDHSVVARDIEAGLITPEEAEHHPRRNVLTQCIGASEDVYAEMYFGPVQKNAVYMLCSDGFRHELTVEEIYNGLRPADLVDQQMMNKRAQALIELNKQRGEDDNISVTLIRTF